MSIRTKFLTVAAVMLLIFALANGLGALLDEESMHHFDHVIHYHQPLIRLVTDLDVVTFEYELAIERLRRKGMLSPAEVQTAKPQITALAAGIRRDLEQSQTILMTAIADAHNAVDERIAMTRISTVLSFLARQIDPFLDQGEKVFSALAAGNADQAHDLARGFVQFEDAFGPDLAAVRTELLGLTDRAAEMVVVGLP
jgi:hypothetical protein